MPFFAQFPIARYDIHGARHSELQTVTNIFFRVAILRRILTNISAYYLYTIKEGDKPETLAEELYGDPTAYWIILYANDIYDPQYDWPLNSRDFAKYITDKYGSVSASQVAIHHYEKVVTRTESFTGIATETRFIIDEEKLTDNDLTVPYDRYDSLADENAFETVNLPSLNRTVVEAIHREAITVYDWENDRNEKKRNIRIIKPIYYSQIMSEFETLTKNRANPYLRRLV